MEAQTIRINQGDTTTIQETIEGLTSLSGYNATLLIHNKAGTEIDTVEGTIEALTITYEIINESSKDYPVGIHEFETKLNNEADSVFTPSKGKFIVDAVLENDPEYTPPE